MDGQAAKARRIVFGQWLRWVDDALALWDRDGCADRDDILLARRELRRLEHFYGSGYEPSREIEMQARIFDLLERLASAGVDTVTIELGLIPRP
jgi:hypothetical protein